MWAQISSSKVELVTSFKFSQSSRGRQTANELDRTLGVRIMEEKRRRRKIDVVSIRLRVTGVLRGRNAELNFEKSQRKMVGIDGQTL